MTPRPKSDVPLPLTWLPGIPTAIAPAPAPPPPFKLRVLPQLGLLAIGLGLISFAAYYTGRSSISDALDQTQAELRAQQVKAKQLNDQLYDAQQALQTNQHDSIQMQAIRAIACPQTGGQ